MRGWYGVYFPIPLVSGGCAQGGSERCWLRKAVKRGIPGTEWAKSKKAPRLCNIIDFQSASSETSRSRIFFLQGVDVGYL